MQRHHLIERDLAAGFPVVKNLQHPLAVAPERPRHVAVVDREVGGEVEHLHCHRLPV